GVYGDAKKSCDRLANIKTNNFLPYALAALHAKKNEWNDALVLNSHDRVCESTVANVFWIKGNVVYTPPLSEGCIGGVTRGHLLGRLKEEGIGVQEEPATLEILLQADELFLTNTISGLRWVK